jgi:hypothetical protein
MIKFAMIVCTVFLLSGCAEKQLTAAARINLNQDACRNSLSEIQARPVTRTMEGKSPNRKLSLFAFEGIAECLKTKGEPIPVALFKLDGTVPSELHMVVNIEKSGAFAAAIDLLDLEYKFLRTVPFSHFVKRGASYTLTEFINANDAKARYVVLRPDAQAFGTNDASVVGSRNETPFLLVAGAVAYYGSFVTGSEKLASRWLSETGKFSVWVDDYALEATKK